MIQMNKIKLSSKVNSFLQYILLTIILIECNSVYSQLYRYHYYIRGSLIAIAILILLIFLVLGNKKKQVNTNIILNSIFYVLACSIIMLLNSDKLNGKIIIILIFMCFLPLMLLYISCLNRYELRSFLDKFVQIVFIISAVSLFFWIFGSILKLISPINQLKVVWGKPYTLMDNYAFVYFDSKQVQDWVVTNMLIPRNISIFAEAPMFAFVILVAMIFNNNFNSCILNKNKRIIINIIFIITLFSTISVTGVVCGLLLIFSNLMKFYNNLTTCKKKIFIIILVVFMLICLPTCIDLVQNKMSTSSTSARIMDLKNGFHVFTENPFIGKGIGHSRQFEDNVETGYGYSNTIIPALTDGGMILTIIYLSPLIVYAIYIVKSKKINIYDIVMLLVYLIIIFTIAVQYRMLLMLLVCIIYYYFIFKIKNIKKLF